MSLSTTEYNAESQESQASTLLDFPADDAQPQTENIASVLASVPSVPHPITPLQHSYTYHSPTPTAPGPYILGVDEAGRGPVLGPMVYGVAYCPVAWEEELEALGFADSKTLNHGARTGLLDVLSGRPDQLGWSVRVLAYVPSPPCPSLKPNSAQSESESDGYSPQDISANMLRRPPQNLNEQSREATTLLINALLSRGLKISAIYVDALGPSVPYQAYLSSLYPTMDITVTPKADSKYKIVGAASIAAKVTRDAWIEGWVFEEEYLDGDLEGGRGGKKGWTENLGSGYPSDPKTQAWLRDSVEPTFGYPSLARFSWGTVRVALDKAAHKVEWIDDGEKTLVNAFQTATGHDKGRRAVARDLAIHSVDSL
ncbi:ribonuclease H-like protein [Sistotremastrum suecicum HHB10207 ss-3]|uniref:Ribonuclease n=1 Tax=Sistotremastrum suecicum HHB10207 ss-3 TaxID=1314776 RepID=A0A165XK76_9AGAM|nr:ribonuclease H-like protein [Sistotremastrum suecicum HHB10207 ss-3]